MNGDPIGKTQLHVVCYTLLWSRIHHFKILGCNSFQNDDSSVMDHWTVHLRCGWSIWRSLLSVPPIPGKTGLLSGPALYWQRQPTPWGKWTSGPKRVSALFLWLFISMREKGKANPCISVRWWRTPRERALNLAWPVAFFAICFANFSSMERNSAQEKSSYGSEYITIYIKYRAQPS